MIDGAFLRKKYRSAFRKDVTAGDIQNFVEGVKQKTGISAGESYRVYFYDCEPCSITDAVTPIEKKQFDFTKQPVFKKMKKLLKDIKLLDFFAVRLGQLSFSDWQLKRRFYASEKPYTDDSFSPDLKQKGVDIKIGLDIAWASYNNMTEKVILVTGDSDFIPAIKTARRNGVFVYLLSLNHMIKSELSETPDVLISDGIKEFFTR